MVRPHAGLRDSRREAPAPALDPAFVDHLPGVLWTTDLELVITFAGGGGLAEAGVDTQALVGSRVDELPAASPLMAEAHAAAVEHGTSSRYDVSFGDRFYSVRVGPVYRDGGELAGTIGVGTDVTPIHALRRQFERLAEQCPDILIRFDRDLRHLYVSPAVELATGRPPSHYLGHTNRELGMPDEACDLWERELDAVIADAKPRTFEFELELPRGRRWFEVHAVPEISDDGSVETVLSFTRDRTEAHAAQVERLATEHRYRELFDLAPDLIVVGDRDGVIVDVNPAVEEILGYAPGQVIGRPSTELLTPADGKRVETEMRRKLEGKAAVTTYEVGGLARDGSVVPLEVTSRAISEGGELVGVLAFGHDMRRREAVRLALEESERRFRGAFDDAAVGMLLTDPDGLLIRVNETFATMLGYTREELEGRPVQEIIHADDVAALAADIQAMRDGAKRSRFAEKRYRRKDGTFLFGRVGISLVRGCDGEPSYFVAQVEDVTELHRVQRELAEIQQLNQLVVDNSLDVLTVMNAAGEIVLCSPAVETALGYRPEELHGKQFADYVHAEDVPLAVEAVSGAPSVGFTPRITRTRVRAKDGTYRIFEGTASSAVGSDGTPALVVTNSRDVTEQLELEEHLLQAQRLEAVGRLAGGIAHDFNNLLVAIRGHAELGAKRLERGEGGSEDDFRAILGAADRAAALTRQLLAFSRRQVMFLTTFDLSETAAGILSLLRRLIGEHIDLELLEPDEPVPIRADPGQIEQVVMNLAVNARDAMPNGGRLTIAVEVVDDAAVLTVEDDGIGMDADTRLHAFEPFYTTKADGTGLGLATVHGIVTQSGGTIELESRPGEGTRFTIRFPLDTMPEAVVEASAPPATEPATDLHGAETILLVEDDAVVRDVVATMLAENGYCVVEAGDADEAVAVARHAEVELLITDLVMPGINGRRLAERLRSDDPALKTIYMSGYTEDEAVRLREFDSMTRFMEKPFDSTALLQCVRALLG